MSWSPRTAKPPACYSPTTLKTVMAFDPVTKACAEHLRTLDHRLYLGCLFAQPQDHCAIFGLQALHAELGRVRESVSEPMLGEIRYTWWREALEEVSLGKPRAHPVIAAIAQAANAGAIDVDTLFSMIDVRQVDLYREGARSQQHVQSYAFDTGGALYAAIARAVGADPATQELAAQSGAAASTIGIVRAAGFHAEMQHASADTAEKGEAVFAGSFTPDLKATLDAMGQAALATLKEGLSKRVGSRYRSAVAPLISPYLTGVRAAGVQFDPEQTQAPPSTAHLLWRTWRYTRLGWL